MDRHKLEEAIKHGKEMLDVFGGEHAEFIEVAIDCIDKALSQPEIIHCAECKNILHFKNIPNDIEWDSCSLLKREVNTNDFCSWGERRTDERKEENT